MDPIVVAVPDEIALEGLDGITLDGENYWQKVSFRTRISFVYVSFLSSLVSIV
jgi:hypothetical protein